MRHGRVLRRALVALAVVGVGCAGRSRDHKTTYIYDEVAGAGGSSAGGQTGAAGGAPAGQAGKAGRGGAGGMAGRAGMANEAGAACDTREGNLELITVTPSCRESNGDATTPRLTPDARYLTFDSDADSLVPTDQNTSSDAFLFDRETRQFELISKRYGSESPTTGYGFTPVASDDGRYVLFTGLANDLVVPAPPEGIWAYLRDRRTGTVERLLESHYACAYSIGLSGDARYAVVEGNTNCRGGRDPGDYLSAVEYRLMGEGSRELGETGVVDNYHPVISRDGRFVLWKTFPFDSGPGQDMSVMLYDRESDSTETLPVAAVGIESLGISDDGQTVAFTANGGIYRYHRAEAELEAITLDASGEWPNEYCSKLSLSGDGQRFVFQTLADNIVAGDTNEATDVFFYDAVTKTFERLSVAADGTEADDDSEYPSISGDGSTVTFVSKARNLSRLATAGNWQVYVRTL